MTPADLRAHALDHLAQYLAAFPEERDALEALAAQLADDPADVFARANMRGHVTTSGIVYDAAAEHCTTRTLCSPEGLQLDADARQAATVSTIAFVGGGIALATGAVLYFTAPRSVQARRGHVRMLVGFGEAPGVRFAGTF